MNPFFKGHADSRYLFFPKALELRTCRENVAGIGMIDAHILVVFYCLWYVRDPLLFVMLSGQEFFQLCGCPLSSWLKRETSRTPPILGLP